MPSSPVPAGGLFRAIDIAYACRMSIDPGNRSGDADRVTTRLGRIVLALLALTMMLAILTLYVALKGDDALPDAFELGLITRMA